MLVGIQFRPEHCTVADLRKAWREADAMGVHSLFVWDHFFPITGDTRGAHFEAWTLATAMAVETKRAEVGVLCSGADYRNADLLCDMARTIDHLSNGRAVLGLGAGWTKRDYDEYGYAFASVSDRVTALESSLERIAARRAQLHPQPVGRLPVLIGAAGERRSLGLVARFADVWNCLGTPEVFRHKSAVLDRHCAAIGRAPESIRRTVLVGATAVPMLSEWQATGVDQLIYSCPAPFDLSPVAAMLGASPRERVTA